MVGHLEYGTVILAQRLKKDRKSLRKKPNIPRFPHPTAGQKPTFSPATQAPPNAGGSSVPFHSLHETSVNFPVKAPRPDGKKADAPPVSSQISKLLFQSLIDLHASSQGEGLLEV